MALYLQKVLIGDLFFCFFEGIRGGDAAALLKPQRLVEAEGESEHGTLAVLRLDSDRSTQVLHESLDDGQTYTGTAVVKMPAVFELREQFEKFFLVFGFDADAGVDDLET